MADVLDIIRQQDCICPLIPEAATILKCYRCLAIDAIEQLEEASDELGAKCAAHEQTIVHVVDALEESDKQRKMWKTAFRTTHAELRTLQGKPVIG